jgi:hypothetical protein
LIFLVEEEGVIGGAEFGAGCNGGVDEEAVANGPDIAEAEPGRKRSQVMFLPKTKAFWRSRATSLSWAPLWKNRQSSLEVEMPEPLTVARRKGRARVPPSARKVE